MGLAITIFGIISYSAMTFFVGYSFIRLRKLGDTIHTMSSLQRQMVALLMGMKLRSDMETADDMKRTLNRMIKNEDFEGAERMKEIIVKHTDSMLKLISAFKENFGDIADIDIEIIKKKQ